MTSHFDMNAYTNALNTHDPNKAAEAYANDCELITPDLPDGARGKEAIREVAKDWFRMFNDVRTQVIMSSQEGDTVSALIRAQGTNTGDIELSPGHSIPATGKHVDYQMAAFLTLDSKGKIKKETIVFDNGSIMEQLGVSPSEWAEGPDASAGSPSRR